MRTTFFARSAVAVASLAIGSIALAAVPATAAPGATANGTTREQVLAVAKAVRAGINSQADYEAYQPTLTKIANRACAVNADEGEYLEYAYAEESETSGSADGFIGFGYVENRITGDDRNCTFGAVAATDAGFSLTGTATLDVPTVPRTNNNAQAVSSARSNTSTLSDDVFVTPSIAVDFNTESQQEAATFTAGGASVKVTKTTTVTKVKDKKSKKQKKAAKAKYSARLDRAETKYDKALDKAGSSKSKKAAAKKAFRTDKAAAKAKYRYAVANYKLVKKTASSTDSRPFSIKASGYID